MSLARIALVKGEDNSLPSLTRDDCHLILRARFLPYHTYPPSEVAQIIGWFDPQDGTAMLVEQVEHGNRQELAYQVQDDGSMVTEMLASTLRVNFSCRAATAPPPLPVLPSAQRTLCVALAGEGNGVWHDGYLVHFSAAGQVLSLHTAPDTARLFVPEVPLTQQGVEPAMVALPAQGHYLKLCLRAQFAARYGVQRRKFTLVIDDPSLRAMVCVVVFSAMYKVEVVTAAGELPPAWRRLLQNLGVPCIQGKVVLSVSELTQLVPDEETGLLIAQDINSQAAVIPAKMLGKS